MTASGARNILFPQGTNENRNTSWDCLFTWQTECNKLDYKLIIACFHLSDSPSAQSECFLTTRWRQGTFSERHT